VKCSGKPTVRKAQLLSGRRMVQEANAGSRKETGNRERGADQSPAVPGQPAGYGHRARTRKGADVDQVSL
jgi:hypothetical protein